MLQLTLQNDQPIQITDELKNRISQAISDYVITHWEEVVDIETVDSNHIISINM